MWNNPVKIKNNYAKYLLNSIECAAAAPFVTRPSSPLAKVRNDEWMEGKKDETHSVYRNEWLGNWNFGTKKGGGLGQEKNPWGLISSTTFCLPPFLSHSVHGFLLSDHATVRSVWFSLSADDTLWPLLKVAGCPKKLKSKPILNSLGDWLTDWTIIYLGTQRIKLIFVDIWVKETLLFLQQLHVVMILSFWQIQLHWKYTKSLNVLRNIILGEHINFCVKLNRTYKKNHLN